MKRDINSDIEALCREIESRPNTYCIFTQHCIYAPVMTTMRIHHVEILREHSLLSITFCGENDNEVRVSNIKSIKKRDDWFIVNCGIFEDEREYVIISRGWPDSEALARLRIRLAS